MDIRIDRLIYGWIDGYTDGCYFVYNNPTVEDESCLQLKHNLLLTEVKLHSEANMQSKAKFS